jgi:hypothetical protein
MFSSHLALSSNAGMFLAPGAVVGMDDQAVAYSGLVRHTISSDNCLLLRYRVFLTFVVHSLPHKVPKLNRRHIDSVTQTQLTSQLTTCSITTPVVLCSCVTANTTAAVGPGVGRIPSLITAPRG